MSLMLFAGCLCGIAFAWLAAALLAPISDDGRPWQWARVATPYLLITAAAAAVSAVLPAPPRRRHTSQPTFVAPLEEEAIGFFESPWVRLGVLVAAALILGWSFAQV